MLEQFPTFQKEFFTPRVGSLKHPDEGYCNAYSEFPRPEVVSAFDEV